MRVGSNNQKIPWSVFEALLVFIIILSIKRILPFPKIAWFNSLSKAISPGNVFLGQVFWNSLFVALFFFVLIGLILKLKYSLTWREVGLKQGAGKNWLTMGISQGILLFFIMTILVTMISLFFPFEVEEQAIVDIFKTAWGWRERFLCLLIVSVFAPFSEELYFRGFLYPAVSKRRGKLPAVIITSIFFSFLHFDLVRFIPITLGGIWLNLLYIRTGSLYTSMVAHSVWNALMISLLFYAQSAGIV